MIDIENNLEGYVQLWRKLERTRLLLMRQCKRFCIRRVLKSWFGLRATDDFIWDVCQRATIDEELVCAWDILPPPALSPRPHRELLAAIASVVHHLPRRQIRLKALDKAYSIVFPHSTPINVNKKKRKPP